MNWKRLLTIAAFLCSVSGVAQVQPSGLRSALDLSAGGGLDYWWGDWGGAVKRWGPSAWVTASIWHGIGVNVEGHSMTFGGGSAASNYKYAVGEGGLIYTDHHWRTILPYAKAELGFASLSHPPNGTSQLHLTSTTWGVGGGVEYHTWRRFWTRVDYTYDGVPNFHSPVSGQYHTLDPKGFTLGEAIHFR